MRPDAKCNWLNQTSNDFDTLIPVVTRDAKAAKSARQEKAVFKLFSLGVVTNRDEWVYDDSADHLEAKVRHLIDVYNVDVAEFAAVRSSKLEGLLNASIKWTRALKSNLRQGVRYKFDGTLIVKALYRPFVKRWLYFSRQLNEMQYQTPSFFGHGKANQCLLFSAGKRGAFTSFASASIPCLDNFSPDACQVVGRFRLDEDGVQIDNITDWALDQFKKHYQPGRGRKARPITKEAIFHYVYGVLHDPAYREKYAQNLKREFPRIPFYDDFWQWAQWGKTLMDLHIGYETVKPWPLRRTDRRDEGARKAGLTPKAMLKADKESGHVQLDSETTLAGIPPEAWEYRLGNRSALEWVLDQYKEKKPKDPTIRARFDTYRFADYKEQVIDLLARVTTVSVETVRITREMSGVRR